MLFAPFILRGEALFSNTDSLFAHYPNLVFGYRALRNGDFGLWNPYVFGGTDFTASMHHHFLNPAYWWLVVVPERYFFEGLTLQFLIEVALVGVLALKIFRTLFRGRLIATTLAIATQLSGFVWFTITTFIGTLLTVEMLACIYLLVSAHQRRAAANYVLLSACFGAMLLSGHIAYVIAFGLPVLLTIAILAIRSSAFRSVALLITVACSGLTGLLIGLVRLWPVINDLLKNPTIAQNWIASAPGNVAYMLVSGFIPGAWGYDLGQTAEFMLTLGVGGRHGQFHNMLYFGVPALAVVYLASTGTCGRLARACAWAFAAMCATQTLGVQPIADVLQFVTWPVTQEIQFRVLMAVFGVVATAAAVMALTDRRNTALTDRRNTSSPDVHLRGFIVLTLVVVAVALTGFAKFAHATAADFSSARVWTATLQTLRIAVALLIAMAIWVANQSSDEAVFLRHVSSRAVVGCWALGFAVVLFAIASGAWREHLVVLAIVCTFATMTWTGVTWLWSTRPHLPLALMALLYTSLAALLVVPLPEGFEAGWGTIAIAPALETLRFVMLACATADVFHQSLMVRRSRLAFLLFFGLLTAGDLLFFNKTYQYSGAPPFQKVSTMYPGFSDAIGLTSDRQPTSGHLLRDERFQSIGGSRGWSGGGRAPSFSVHRSPSEDIATILNSADDYATLFQDVTVGGDAPVVFGAWVRAERGVQAGVILGDVVYHSGSGNWEYLFSVRRGGGTVSRPTLFVKGPGQAQFAFPFLFDGEVPTPQRIPIGATMPTIARPRNVSDLDLARYRVNRPWILTRHPYGPVQSSINTLYAIPTYGGVDSAVNPDLVEFISQFVPVSDNWYTRAGIRPLLNDARLLDVLGVKYDFDEQGRLQERMNALARFSLFRNFEIVSAPKEVPRRLCDPQFDPMRRVVLSSNPGWMPDAIVDERFSAPTFSSRGTTHLEVRVNSVAPSVLLFNDVYSDGWRATVDGSPAEVIRANGIFMAVPLPRGAQLVTLDFRPEPFLTMAAISVLTAAFVGLASLTIVSLAARRRWRLAP